MTFNQVVRGSNPRTLMQIGKNFKGSCFFLYFYLILCIIDIRDKRRGNRSYELNKKSTNEDEELWGKREDTSQGLMV